MHLTYSFHNYKHHNFESDNLNGYFKKVCQNGYNCVSNKDSCKKPEKFYKNLEQNQKLAHFTQVS